MQLRLKIDFYYQPSPQKGVEEKGRKAGKSSPDRVGLEKVKCAGNEAESRARLFHRDAQSLFEVVAVRSAACYVLKGIFHTAGRQLRTRTPECTNKEICHHR